MSGGIRRWRVRFPSASAIVLLGVPSGRRGRPGTARHSVRSWAPRYRRADALRRAAAPDALRRAEARWDALARAGDGTAWVAEDGARPEWLSDVHPDDRADAERAWRQAVADRSGLDLLVRCTDGDRTLHVRAAPVRGCVRARRRHGRRDRPGRAGSGSPTARSSRRSAPAACTS